MTAPDNSVLAKYEQMMRLMEDFSLMSLYQLFRITFT